MIDVLLCIGTECRFGQRDEPVRFQGKGKAPESKISEESFLQEYKHFQLG